MTIWEVKVVLSPDMSIKYHIGFHGKLVFGNIPNFPWVGGSYGTKMGLKIWLSWIRIALKAKDNFVTIFIHRKVLSD